MDTTELAWAAGVYDGEGSASTYLPRSRRSRVRQIAVYQSCDDGVPSLLRRFHVAVGGRGLIHGPSRGSLYQWHSKRHVVVDEVSELLWPWLNEPKRQQLARAALDVGRPAPAVADTAWPRDELVAWAAGFFDGEGSIGAYGKAGRWSISMSLSQASAAAAPRALLRFRDAVDAGQISGPRMVSSPWSKLPQYEWRLRRFDEVERVVELLRPYADRVKTHQMEVALAEARMRRAGPRGGQSPSGRSTSPAGTFG